MGQQVSTKEENHCGYKSYKYEYKWTVSNFKSYSVGVRALSSDLYLDVEGERFTFKLMLYPHGYNERVKNYISLYFKRGSPVASWDPTEMLIQFTCAILNSENNQINVKSLKQKMSIETHLGWVLYCRRDFLFDNEKTILSDGNLTLICTIEIFQNKAIVNAVTEDDDPNMSNSLANLSANMNQLLLERDFSDVSIKVEDQKFPAHKAILSARSPVFKAMLKWRNVVNSEELIIEDINAETVKKMLIFIYSGNVTNLDVEEALTLYYAADKYQMQNLKTICSKILLHNLDTENALDILLFGDRHSDNDLKYGSIEFIAKNASVIQKEKEWMLFMKHYPELANVVFKESLRK